VAHTVEWKATIDNVASFHDKGGCSLTKRPKDNKIIYLKWLFICLRTACDSSSTKLHLNFKISLVAVKSYGTSFS